MAHGGTTHHDQCGCEWVAVPEMVGKASDDPERGPDQTTVKTMQQQQAAVVPVLACKYCGEEVKG